MSLWNKYPYSSMHELNLDWILKLMQELHADWDEFTALNKITNAGAWDITKQYQAWTVVSDNNVGYISLKAVPAGIAINNIEYWGVIADYNILITNLSNRISTLENSMNTLNNTTIPGIQNDINEIENSIYWDNKKFWFIGDSFTQLSPSWCSEIDSFTGKTSVVTGDGGIGFVNLGNNTNVNLATLVSNVSTDMTDITDVVIVAGINDCKSDNINDFDTDFTSCLNNVITKAPNANIWVIFNATYFTTNYSARYPYISQIYSKMISHTPRIGKCRFLKSPLFAIQYVNYLASDGVHPNSAGSTVIALTILNEMKNGSPVAPIYDVTSNGLHYHLCEMDNVSISTRFGDILYNDSNNPINVGADTFTDLVSNMYAPILPKHTYQFAFPCKLRLFNSSNQTQETDGIVLPRMDNRLSILSRTAFNNCVMVMAIDSTNITVPIMSYV